MECSVMTHQKERLKTNHEDLIPLEKIHDDPVKIRESDTVSKGSEKSSRSEKSAKSSPSREENVIDLKEFVVGEVRRNAEQYIIDFSTLIFNQKVGYGNSSEVFKGEWRGREVAIKKIKDNLSRSEKEFKREIMTSVKTRHHPQLVTLIGVSEHDGYFYIINEFCNGVRMRPLSPPCST